MKRPLSPLLPEETEEANDAASFAQQTNAALAVWLNEAHCSVDKVLADYPAIDKIKTVGEMVLLAGPFDESKDSSLAGRQLIAAICDIRHAIGGIQAGCHVGELVGAVLGMERLCFDIFGDAVNVASRTMTSSHGEEGMTVTEEFHSLVTGSSTTPFTPADHLHAGDEPCVEESPQSVRWSDPFTAQAKGKGEIQLRRVVEWASRRERASSSTRENQSMVTNTSAEGKPFV